MKLHYFSGKSKVFGYTPDMMTEKAKKWHAVSGSWRNGAALVEQDVRSEVRAVIAAGEGIVTGGALGVDYIATDEAMKQDPSGASLKIILPTPLSVYIRHYFNRAAEGVITEQLAKELSAQLTSVHAANPQAIIEMDFDKCNEETYYARNSAVVEAADALLAFQVNGSKGTQDTIDKAVARGLPVKHRTYKV